MKWAVVEAADQVDVMPTTEDGTPFFHVLGVECLCAPTLEQHRRVLVIHHLTSQLLNRRNVMRVWNLRRELRGKRWGVRR